MSSKRKRRLENSPQNELPNKRRKQSSLSRWFISNNSNSQSSNSNNSNSHNSNINNSNLHNNSKSNKTTPTKSNKNANKTTRNKLTKQDKQDIINQIESDNNDDHNCVIEIWTNKQTNRQMT